jgi:hypothetical protein
MKLMNHAKIAAALHALADAFLADVEAVEAAVTGKGKGKKAATDPTPAAAVTQGSSPASAAPASAEPAAAAPAPTVTLKQVNELVLKVAAKNRDGAVALLGKFGLANTVGLAEAKWQVVYDAFEEEIAKIDAAAVQVAQASLV